MPMFTQRAFIGVLAIIFLLPLASVSHATLWDLIIISNIENAPLYSGDRPIVSGVVLDQASKPVAKAEINVKSGSMSIFTKTSQSGEFRVELGSHERVPGNYIVNISAVTSEGKTGIASIQFQIKGEISPSTISLQKLSTPEAKKYLNSSPSDFDGNPIGFMLYNYYQKLNQEFLDDEKKAQEILEKQEKINETKEIAKNLRLEAIEEFNPSMGVFSGKQYEEYVNSLDKEARDTVIEHLNFTKNLVEEAQKIRNEILENGGTNEEAQAAYIEKITTSREIIENLGKIQNTTSINDLESPSKNQTAATYEIKTNSSIKAIANGIPVEVDFRESIFFVNVNGTMLEFLVNGTKIVQINNHD